MTVSNSKDPKTKCKGEYDAKKKSKRVVDKEKKDIKKEKDTKELVHCNVTGIVINKKGQFGRKKKVYVFNGFEFRSRPVTQIFGER
jgi:predicted lipase